MVEVWAVLGGLTAALAALADPLTAVLAAAALLAAMLRPSPVVRRWLLLTAVRRPLRGGRAWGAAGDGAPRLAALLDDDFAQARPRRAIDRVDPREVRRRHRVVKALARPLGAVLGGEDITPADLASSLMVSMPVDSPPWPLRAAQLARLLRSASTSQARGLFARLLYPDDTLLLSRYLAQAADHVTRFAEAQPVAEQRLELTDTLGSGTARGFAAFASALSGAVVLVDSLNTRSGFADGVLVWHSRRYRGPVPARPAPDQVERDAATYEALHGGSRTCGMWDAGGRPAGDYDSRLLALEAVSLAECPTTGTVSFVLETTETCYAATERGESTDPAAPALGSKHIRPAARSDGDPTFAASSSPGACLRVVRAPGRGRVTPVTAYVSVITSDNTLVLARRSGKVRHGKGVVSAAAGGLVEPGGSGAHGDIDHLGMPSILTGILREVREEIGLDLEPQTVHPVCVFMANIRNKGGNPAKGDGQLVAAVLYLARVSHHSTELAPWLARADSSLGAFELDGLVPVDLGPSPATTAAPALASFAQANAEQLDQHGLLSCLYTAAVLADDPRTVASAFQDAFPRAPWWDVAASPRLVRDTRALLGGPDGVADVAAWRSSWSTLGERLDALPQTDTKGVRPTV